MILSIVFLNKYIILGLFNKSIAINGYKRYNSYIGLLLS